MKTADVASFLSGLDVPEREALIAHAVLRLAAASTSKRVLLAKSPNPQLELSDIAAEEWKLVTDDKDDMEISSLGRCRKTTLRGIEEVEPYVTGRKGHRQVQVGLNRKRIYVHQLVAEAFLSKSSRPDQCHVNHLDSNPGNNAVANLEWSSIRENLQHASVNNLFGYGDARSGRAKELKSAISKLEAFIGSSGLAPA